MTPVTAAACAASLCRRARRPLARECRSVSEGPAEPSEPSRHPWRSRHDVVIAALVTVLAPLLALRAVVLSGFALVPGDVNDGRLNAFFLEHSWGWLTGQPLHRPLWSLPMFFPGGGNALAFSDPMVSFGPFYWPWRALGMPPDTSYQLWCLGALGASALAGYLFLRLALGLSPPAATLGAWLATCSASRLHQISHSQLLPLFYVLGGLGAAVAWARLEDRRRRWVAAAAAAASLVLQLYGGFYQGFFLVLVAAVLVLVAMAFRVSRRALLRRLRADWLALAAIALLAGVALWPWLAHYRAAQEQLGPRPWAAVETMVPRPLSWLYMPPGALAYGWIEHARAFRRLPWNFEHAVGLGFLTTACVLAGAWAARRCLAVRLTVLTTVVVMVLTTMVDGQTLWRQLVEEVPALGAVRALARVGLLMPLGAAVVLGNWLDHASSRRGRAVVLALLVLAGAEQLARLDSHRRDPQRFWVGELASRVDPDAVAFVATRSSDRGGAMLVHVDAMLAANLTGVPTVNGASGNEPPGWEGLQWARVRNETAAVLFRGAMEDWLRAGGVEPARVQWIRLPPRYRGGDGARRRAANAG
jgi:hypothetical protein